MAHGHTAEHHAKVADRCRAWSLRMRGWTQERIGHELGVDQGTISRWLAAVERDELAKLRESVERRKAHQNGVLEHILDESLQAWERSKRPKKRIQKRETDGKPRAKDKEDDSDGDSSTTTEVVERDGEEAYLDRALATLQHLRKLWGLDVAEKSQDGGPGSFAEVMRRLKGNAARFAAERAAEAEEAQACADEPPPPPPAAAGEPDGG